MENAEILKQIADFGTKLEEALKSSADKKSMDALCSEVNKYSEQIKQNAEMHEALKKELNEKIRVQAEELAVLKKHEDAPLSSIESLKKALLDTGAFESYTIDGVEKQRVKASHRDNGVSLSIPLATIVKSAVDMDTSGAVRPGGSPGMSIGSLTNYGMMREVVPTSIYPHFSQIFRTMPTEDKYFGIVIEDTLEDGTAVKAEDTAGGKSSFLLKTIEYKVFDVCADFRVHENTLDDLDYILTDILTIGMDKLESKLDSYTLNTSGNGTTSVIGIRTSGYFTAYDTTLRAGKVYSPNIVDVIKNAKLQANNQAKLVDTVIMNPNDIAEIESLKDLEANSVTLAGVKLDQAGNLAYIYGLRVVAKTEMTEGSLVVCKSDSVTFGVKSMADVRIGYDVTTDFSKGIKTIQLKSRVAVGIGSPLGIIYCSSITDAITALTNVSGA